MNSIKSALTLCIAILLVACGGGDLSIELPGQGETGTLDLEFRLGEAVEHRLPFRISGGVPPYSSSIEGCPEWVTLFADQGILAGTAPARDHGRTFHCTYVLTDSMSPESQRTSFGLSLVVGSTVPLAISTERVLRFVVGTYNPVMLNEASGGVRPHTHAFTCAGGTLPPGMGFAPATRVFAGVPQAPFHDSCVYSVTDSSQPPQTVSQAVEVEVAAPVVPPLELPEQVVPGNNEHDVPTNKVGLIVGTFYSKPFRGALRGIEPHRYTFTCAGGTLPSGMGFAPATRIFSGTPRERFRDSCTYTVTDASQPAMAVSRAVDVEVTGAAEDELELPEEIVPGNRVHVAVQRRVRVEFEEAMGGVPPHTYEIPAEECDLPAGLAFRSDTRTLSGTATQVYRGPDCTYRVTDSDTPPASVSRSFELIVEPLDMNMWRFRTRSVAESQHEVTRTAGTPVTFAVLPHAIAGEADTDAYELLDLRAPLSFAAATRQLTYTHPNPAADPLLGTPTTHRYQVFVGTGADRVIHDALCVDLGYTTLPDPDDTSALDLYATVFIRDDAFWNGTEYRCPDAPPSSSSAGAAPSPSNPVHSALGPVHARRAVDVAHSAVRDHVRGWSPGASRARSAVAPTFGFASLSGLSEGFDYTGSSRSASIGADVGAGVWQAGLVASVTRTDLRYTAEADLSAQGYRAGEHDTEILSVHPFAAWHARSGGHLWASLGAGAGDLRHRDDLGFPSWSRSDVGLRSYAAGASVPLADVLSGELGAEAGIESFAFEIEGGGRISTSLPTLRGRDYRAGLAWSAPVAWVPSMSVAYRRSTGDGPEGARVEAQGSVSVAGIFDPRLSLIGSGDASFGLGDHEHESWRLGGGVRFASDDLDRGFGLDVDTRLTSLTARHPDGVGVRGEAGYGFWGGPFLGLVRPYVGLIRSPGDDSLRWSMGLNLRDTPTSQASIEVFNHSRNRSRDFEITLRQRF